MGLVRSPFPARRVAALCAVAAVALACGSRRQIATDEAPLCERCHGGNGSAAPPRSARGATATTDRGVGAHARHLALQGDDVAAALPCESCHAVPTTVEEHLDGVASVRLPPLANVAGRPAAAWDPTTGTCKNVYCHGAGFAPGQAGDATEPSWTYVDGPVGCGSCHAARPASHASFGSVTSDPASCHGCHDQTVRADGTIDVAGGKHVDGLLQAPSGGACDGCHGAPPATGAHLAHANAADPASLAYGSLAVSEDVSPAGRDAYEFGCGHCHPTDPARHMDGQPQIVLTPPATAVAGDEIKARNAPDAAYDRTTGECSGVYCHSSGQETPAYAATPPWTSAPGALGCGGCHGNPPRYPSGGAGSPTANGHLVLADDGWESGHFQGLPGYWHTSKHGGDLWPGNDAAAMTCQTCHVESVDPGATGPSEFYWLDTTGDYQLGLDAPGADPSRAGPFYDNLQCTACHDGVRAAARGGKAWPLRHVNGKRDVAFDARPALPAISWLPGAPSTPTRPYWVTNAAPSVSLPNPAIPDATMDGSTLSLHLQSASYDPASKTCSTVACHLMQTTVQWGAPHGYGPDWNGCTYCHPM